MIIVILQIQQAFSYSLFFISYFMFPAFVRYSTSLRRTLVLLIFYWAIVWTTISTWFFWFAWW